MRLSARYGRSMSKEDELMWLGVAALIAGALVVSGAILIGIVLLGGLGFR